MDEHDRTTPHLNITEVTNNYLNCLNSAYETSHITRDELVERLDKIGQTLIQIANEDKSKSD